MEDLGTSVEKWNCYWNEAVHKEFEVLKENFKKDFNEEFVMFGVRSPDRAYHLNVLCAFLKKLKGEDLSVLEVGSYRGQSTRIFSEYFKDVQAVDPFGKTNELSDINDLEESNKSHADDVDMAVKVAKENDLVKFIFENNCVNIVDNIKHHHLTSDDFFLKYSGQKKFDFIYIDGDHRYSQQIRDYTNSLNFLKENGVVGGHDFSWESTQKVIKDMGWHSRPMIHFMDDSFLIVPEELL